MNIVNLHRNVGYTHKLLIIRVILNALNARSVVFRLPYPLLAALLSTGFYLFGLPVNSNSPFHSRSWMSIVAHDIRWFSDIKVYLLLQGFSLPGAPYSQESTGPEIS